MCYDITHAKLFALGNSHHILKYVCCSIRLEDYFFGMRFTDFVFVHLTKHVQT